MDDLIINQSKRALEHCEDPESSAAPHSVYGKPVLLSLGLKVFLSHSGLDKDFVRRLYRKILGFYDGINEAFFDEVSLPKGKAINMETSILEEARNSTLGVLVLTEDFFMHTPNPMLELEAFVAGNVDLLPLFFKMSVDEFKQKDQWNKWEKQWEKWATADDKLVIDKWKSYLPAVARVNGVEFCKIAPHLGPHDREDLYIDEVVRQVASIIGPALPMCGNDVYGKDRLCQVIDDMYKECSSKRASTSSSLDRGENNGSYAYDVVGIYGFSGLGKTTLSKCLCDFYYKNMKGNVCYIDLGSSSETLASRMWHVVSSLDRRYCKDIDSRQRNDSQMKNLLKVRLSSMQYPVFLAIDNIAPEKKSLDEALIYLTCNFPKSSKIFITSKTERTLTKLLKDVTHDSCSFSTVIDYMPELEFTAARDIFKHEFPDLHNFRFFNLSAAEEKIQRDVDAIVRMCTIFSYRKRYHPLMLKSLAAFVKWDELLSDLGWKGRLAKLASEGIVYKDDAWEQVYELFDKFSFELLKDVEKKVFLDLALCFNAPYMCREGDYLYEWIQMLHLNQERDLKKILLRLHNYCLIEFIEKESHKINIHDLMAEYGKFKAQRDNGYLVSEGGGVPDALPKTPRYVSISRCPKDQLRTLDLRNVKGMTVLHLLDNAGLEEVLLSRTASAHLRSMIVNVPAGTALRCIVNKKKWSSDSLKFLQIKGNFDFCFQSASERSLMLPNARMDPGWISGGFRNLSHFSLDSLLQSPVHTIDLTPCAYLKVLHVNCMPGLKFIRGPESSSYLEQAFIHASPDLEELVFTVPAHYAHFLIDSCASLQQVSLHCTATSESGFFCISGCPLLANVDGLSQYVADGNRHYSFDVGERDPQQHIMQFRPDIFVDMQVKDAPIDFSRCKATVTELEIDGAVGLRGVRALSLQDAQHVGPLISALFQAQPTCLKNIEIRCQQAGDIGSCGCACDENPPNFCALPREKIKGDPFSFYKSEPRFYYCCQQVRDLSSLREWWTLRELTLSRCTGVEVWPNFEAMTALGWLDLSNNPSLREWPAGVDLLPLKYLDLRGCPQLPAKELMLRTITPTQPWDSIQTSSWYLASPLRLCRWAFASLREDLKDGTRDRCTVASALDELSKELAAIFDRWWPNSTEELQILHAILGLIDEVWFWNELEQQHIMEILRSELLKSESFLSLPFRACSTGARPIAVSFYAPTFYATTGVVGVLGIYTALVGGRASCSTHSYRALRHDDRLQDRAVFFFKHVFHSLLESMTEYAGFLYGIPIKFLTNKNVVKVVREEVGVALSRMAREAGLEVEEGSTESQELQHLRERAVKALCRVAKLIVGRGNIRKKVLLFEDDVYPGPPFMTFPRIWQSTRNITTFLT